MERLKAEHPDLSVLDHHKSAREELEGLEYCTFDMEKSGARLTLEHLANIGESVSIHGLWLVDYTEDRDLWRWHLPDSKAINSAMRSYPLDFETWQGLSRNGARKLVPEGEAILRAEEGIIRLAVKNTDSVIFHGHDTCIFNVTSLISEIGNAICKIKGMSLTYFITPTSDVVFSLRSAGEIDVGAIAKDHGGGGHHNAAGFQGNFALLQAILDGAY